MQQGVAEDQGRSVGPFVVGRGRGQQAGAAVHEDQAGGQALSDPGLETESGEGDQFPGPFGEVGTAPVGDGPYGDAAGEQAADAVRARLPRLPPQRAVVEDEHFRLGGVEHGVEAGPDGFGTGDDLDAGRGAGG